MTSYISDLEKLAELYKKKVITKAEFEEQKKALLERSAKGGAITVPEGAKSQAIYVLLAFFLGSLGIHNFYAGYMRRGLAQLALGILSYFTYGLTGAINFVWVFINILGIDKDAKGVPFKPSPVAKIIAAIFMGLGAFLMIIVALIVALASAGLLIAKSQATDIISYTRQAVMTAKISGTLPRDGALCDVFITEKPEDAVDAQCFIFPLGPRHYAVQWNGLPAAVQKAIVHIDPDRNEIRGDSVVLTVDTEM